MPSEARRADFLTTALLVIGPAALLGGAFAFQYWGGLYPCEMCWWQRWALMAALVPALVGALLGRSRRLLALAALAVLAGAGIAVFHAGVEQHWWQGLTRCAVTPTGSAPGAMLTDLLAQPLVRCDAIAWSLFGISMAGWNAIVSTAIGGLALWRLRRA